MTSLLCFFAASHLLIHHHSFLLDLSSESAKMEDNHQNSHNVVSRPDSPGPSLSLKSSSEYELSMSDYPWLAKTRDGHYCYNRFHSHLELSTTSTTDVERGDIAPHGSESVASESRRNSLEHSNNRLSPLFHSRSAESIEDPNLVSKRPIIASVLANSLQVSWSGPHDPANPLNWTRSRKWVATVLVSCFTFISPVSSTMVAPALPELARQFRVSSPVEQIFLMSIFLLAYAVGPFLLGPLSEIFGRVVVLQSANMFYLVFNTACGFARTKEEMLAFRFLSGLGGSAPQAV